MLSDYAKDIRDRLYACPATDQQQMQHLLCELADVVQSLTGILERLQGEPKCTDASTGKKS